MLKFRASWHFSNLQSTISNMFQQIGHKRGYAIINSRINSKEIQEHPSGEYVSA